MNLSMKTFGELMNRVWRRPSAARLLESGARLRAAAGLLATGLSLIGLVLVPARHSSAQPVDPSDDSLRLYYAVHVGNFHGVYLGHGLIITAAHVVNSAVRIADLDLAAKIMKVSPFEQLDLALLSVDEETLPVSLRLRRMPLCQKPVYPGQPVVSATPEGTTRAQIVSPLVLPPKFRQRFSTVINDVATSGRSGSGVFDAGQKCLLGILSRKFSVKLPGGGVKDIATYFVPADAIQSFIPVGSEMAILQTGVAQKLAEQSLPSLIVTPSSNIEFSGPQGGPFLPSHIEYRISASIGTISYSIRTPSWLTANSTAGSTDTKGITIMLTVNPNASSLAQGTYGPAVAFTNVSNGRGTSTRSAKLIVQENLASSSDKKGRLSTRQSRKVGRPGRLLRP